MQGTKTATDACAFDVGALLPAPFFFLSFFLRKGQACALSVAPFCLCPVFRLLSCPFFLLLLSLLLLFLFGFLSNMIK